MLYGIPQKADDMADGLYDNEEQRMTTDTLSLTDFLLARIAEDEDDARTDLRDYGPDYDSRNNLRAPSRWLAECGAKRRILESHNDLIARCEGGAEANLVNSWWGQAHGLEEAIRHLALPYADHPDYDESWRP